MPDGIGIAVHECVPEYTNEDRGEFLSLLPPVMTQQLIPVVWKAVWEPMRPFLLG